MYPQHSLNLHLCLCRRIAAAKLARKLHKKGSCASSDRPSNFRDKTNVSVEAGVRAKLFSYKKAFITNTRPFFIHIFIIFFNKFLNYI